MNLAGWLAKHFREKHKCPTPTRHGSFEFFADLIFWYEVRVNIQLQATFIA
jgi:hypothetical protein